MTNTQVSTFTFPVTDNTVRTVTINGEPWFVAKDVCDVLGVLNASRAVKEALDVDEYSTFNVDNSRGRPSLIISESGLYGLIAQSRKPTAKDFNRWVRKDVLPAIRKDGAYVVGEEKVASGEMSEDELVLRAIKIMENKVAQVLG